MATLDPGLLNDRIEIRRATLADDGHGGQLKSWSPVATVWAEAVSQSGREAVIAGSLQGVSTYRFTIRSGIAVSTGDQIRFDGREFNVRAADRNSNREQIDILADTAGVEV